MKQYSLVLMFCLLAAALPASAKGFEPGRLGFTVTVNGVPGDFDTFFATTMPSKIVTLGLDSGHVTRDFSLLADGQSVSATDSNRWQWTAPAVAGLSRLTITHRSTGEVMRLTVFTLVPATQVVHGKLNGYQIGDYPGKPLKGLRVYEAPTGFIEVTEANESVAVSPHFKLAQFVCKQGGGYPRYMVLRPRLLLKLEGILGEINARGVKTDSLVIMSGYRTPYYNRLIGNVRYSRHQWGGAADIYVDVAPEDGQMDDLSGDGRTNRLDALWLYRLASRYAGEHHRKDLIGGVGVYNATAAHGPFVHVDVRGERARWGE